MTELLNEPAYLHVLLNHFPTIGLVIALLALLAGLLQRNVQVLRLGLVLVAITAGSSIPVGLYGDAAYPAVFDELDGAGREWLDYHAYLADSWLPLLVFNSVVAIVALLVGSWRQQLLTPAGLIVACVTLAGLTVGVRIGAAGGKVSHAEFRLVDPPAYEASPRER